VLHHATGKDAIEAFTLAITNSSQYGNNALIAPKASVQDGLLDITAVPSINLFNALPLLYRLFSGSLDRVASVRRWQGSTFTLERSKPGWIHTDGEPRAEVSRLEISIRPRSLNIVVPAATVRI
jgi:diacylglycerol kinase family enzyme